MTRVIMILIIVFHDLNGQPVESSRIPGRSIIPEWIQRLFVLILHGSVQILVLTLYSILNLLQKLLFLVNNNLFTSYAAITLKKTITRIIITKEMGHSDLIRKNICTSPSLKCYSFKLG